MSWPFAYIFVAITDMAIPKHLVSNPITPKMVMIEHAFATHLARGEPMVGQKNFRMSLSNVLNIVCHSLPMIHAKAAAVAVTAAMTDRKMLRQVDVFWCMSSRRSARCR